MSPAFKKVIYRVTGAGLLAAAMTCSAANDVTASPSAEVSSIAVASTLSASSVVASPVVQNPDTAVVPATPQNDVQTSANNTNPYYKNANGNNPPIGSGGHLLNVTVGLLLVIGLIFGLSWFVKRFNQGNFSGNSHLKIIATMPLGTRERIALIDVGGQQLLLGITPTHINTLHTFDTPIAANSADMNTFDFGRKLMAILQRPSDAGDQSDQSSGNNNSGKRE